MTDSSMLSAESSPHELGKHSGVRRVNNLPLYLAGGAVGAFLLMMVLVGMDRANKSQTTAQATPVKHSDTTQLVASITGNRTGGMVPAAVIPSPAPAVPAITVPITMPDDLEKPPLPERLKETASANPNAERIRQQKMQLFESAVKSKTAVPIPELKTHAGDSDQRTKTLQRIDNANAAFTARLAQLEGGGEDKPAAPRNDLKSFDATDKSDHWQLGTQVEAPRTRYTLRAGFIIPASLISGINSDLPGQITAQVSQNVYDTATGNYLLLPQGARLVGSYTSNVAYGQSRVMVAWQRIVFPDGKTLDIGAMPGADGAGYSGFHDIADNHYVRILGSAILMSGITAGVSMSQNANSNGGVNAQPTASSALSEALGQQLGNVTAQMISKNLSISPTLEIRPGFRFNVMCIKDLVLTKPYSSFDY
ncbi:MAG: conjugal transfer protein TrbI [Rickettsiales bacterium]|nr:conjugal transfer protein TrbI [Rickettsiales bacterium]